jgi:predicted HTH transcriptional regulator
MLDPHRKIQALIDSFVADLGELAKQIALEQLKIAFGSVKLAPLPPPSSSSYSSYSSSASSASSVSSAAAARRSRARRAHHEIEALRNKLLTVISDNPGCRAEDINSALGTRTPQIAQPLRRLVAERLVRTEGARRGTRYFAVGPTDVQNGRRPAGAEAAASADEPPA